MSLSLLAFIFLGLIIFGYYSYGAFIAKQFELNDKKPTPSELFCDGNDFVPTKKPYLFAQHFSSISAAGPIAGPIIACTIWGYGPCLLWILLGVIFIGAVHDFTSLIASVRHKAVSIAEITKEHMGTKAGVALMLFMWLALIYVIVAFTDITAHSFIGQSEELENVKGQFNPGGAVALAAVLYLSLSLLMGMFERLFIPPLALTTVIFVPLAFISIFIGSEFSTLLVMDLKIWCVLILAYCFIASLMPVWLLLQPRGYLGGYFLYSVIAIGIIGIFFGDFSIQQEAFIAPLSSTSEHLLSSMFPFLFVTIACGACSGFHGLVCSGTTSKQIAKESHTHLIGYGAMLCEALIAFIALVTVIIFAPLDIEGLKPGAIYGKGIGEFLSVVIGGQYLWLAKTFGAVAFSTFVFDTLDVATRLGRYLLQELFSWKGKLSAFVCTLLTVGIPLIFVLLAKEGSYMQFWTLFGASNQLLAALTLLSITIWLYHSKRNYLFTLLPMLFILLTTMWALADLAIMNFGKDSSLFSRLNGLVSLLLLGLALYLVVVGLVRLKDGSRKKGTIRESMPSV